MADENSHYEHNHDFRAVIEATRGERRFYHINWKKHCTYKNAYMAVSVLSFFLMAVFGAVCIIPYQDCFVTQPDGTCCKCLAVDEAKLAGQTIPQGLSLNGVYYGVVMIVNSGFGIFYVINGIRAENKYQLLCMLVTQGLECARGLTDTFFEEPDSEAARQRKTVKEVIMLSATGLLVLCCVLIFPVYKSFGWRIFYRGGSRQTVRDLYKWYQRFRALNRLDVQSSFLLFVLYLMYMKVVESAFGWVWIVLLLSDSIASRYVVKFVKQEDMIGVLIGLAAKVFVVVWWVVVLTEYLMCYYRYEDSRTATEPWWRLPLYPDIESAQESYNGVSCLAPWTFHDRRTWEVILLNFAQALLFRFGSLVVLYKVCRNFGRGLRPVFYRVEAGQRKKVQGDELAEENAQKPKLRRSETEAASTTQLGMEDDDDGFSYNRLPGNDSSDPDDDEVFLDEGGW